MKTLLASHFALAFTGLAVDYLVFGFLRPRGWREGSLSRAKG